MSLEPNDNLFIREMKRVKLAAKYPVSRNRLPMKKEVEMAYGKGKLPHAVDVRVSLRDAAVTRKVIEIRYKKTTSDEVKVYQIEPYSYRYLKLHVGVRKMVFGWDINEKKIKSFALRNIRSAKILSRSFSPRFPVEIGKTIRKKAVRKLER